MNKLKLILGLILIVASIACTTKTPEESKKKINAVKVKLKSNQLGINSSTKGIIISNIHSYNIIIKGFDFTAITENVLASEISNKVYNLKVIDNLIVSLEPLDINGNNVFGDATLCGKKIYGYTDIDGSDIITVDISWKRTPIARVLEILLDTYSFDINSYSNDSVLQTNLQSLVNANSTFNLLSVNAEKISLEINSDSTYSIIDVYPTGIINGSLTNFSEEVLNGLQLKINEPLAAPITLAADHTFQFINVAPGTWKISLESGLNHSVDVTVNDDGTVGSPIEISNVNKTPVVYDWSITTLTVNTSGTDERKAIYHAHVGDEDGLADIQTVAITKPDATIVSLADNGDKTYNLYDIVNDDGIFQVIVDEQLADGSYTINATDQAAANQTGSNNFTFSYIDSAIISASSQIQDGITLTNRNPTLTWDAVAGASYYSVYIYGSAGNLIKSSQNITTTSISITSDLNDDDYTVVIYAYSEQWPYLYPFNNTHDSYEYVFAISIKEISFKVQVTGYVTPNIGDARELYVAINYSKLIKKIDILNKTSETLTRGEGVFGLSPDGLNILYKYNEKLYKIRSNGTRKFLLYSKSGVTVSEAKWASGGNKIAFLVKTDLNRYDLYLINPDGSGRELLLNDLNTSYFFFSPNNESIYFLKDGLSRNINLNTKVVSTLSNCDQAAAPFELSPNKDKILFNKGSFYSCNIITGEQKIINNVNSGAKVSPHWTKNESVIFIVPGYGIKLNSSENYIYSSSDDIIDAKISPCGKKIIVIQKSTNTYYIITLEIDGSNSNSLYNSYNEIKDFKISPYLW